MQNKKYFHDDYTKRIIKLFEEKRYEEVIYKLEKYINNYPNDLYLYEILATAYMYLGNIEEANKILEQITNIITDKTREKNKDMIIILKIRLLCCQKRYRECLESLIENENIFVKNNWFYKGILLYLKKQLGILEAADYKMAKGKYLYSQIVSYSEEEALLHIEKHMEFSDGDNCDKFIEKFPLHEIYFQLREMLPLHNNVIGVDDIKDKYIFKYEANGHVGSKLVDYFAVVTLKDSNDIITMYPYENRERRECIDLTPKNQDPPKAKRMSQIDKFNQRYGKRVDNN